LEFSKTQQQRRVLSSLANSGPNTKSGRASEIVTNTKQFKPDEDPLLEAVSPIAYKINMSKRVQLKSPPINGLSGYRGNLNSTVAIEGPCPFESRNNSLTSMRATNPHAGRKRILSAVNSPQTITSIKVRDFDMMVGNAKKTR